MPPRSAPALPDPTPIPVVELVDLPFAALVRDPALQCRQAMSDATVHEYAERMGEGVIFPPVVAIRVEDGSILLVDGWHRAAAAEYARSCGWVERSTVAAEVRPGTRRDALLAAVRANANHGLPRTQADKRRAVMVLLADAEWCGQSSRELAKLADDSHTFVNQVRERFGLAVGAPLDLEWAASTEGEPSPAWRALLTSIPEKDAYQRGYVEERRRAAGPLALAKSGEGWERASKAAFALRQEELATEPWPWAEDMTAEEVAERAAGLDTVEDLEAACRTRDLDAGIRAELYKVLGKVPRLTEGWSAKSLATELAGRPRLAEIARKAAEKADAREARERAKYGGDVCSQAHAIERHADPEVQAEAVRTASAEVLAKLSTERLHADVRNGVLRDRLDPERSAPACPDPRCDGWLAPPRYEERWCVNCRRTPKNFALIAGGALDTAASLLAHEGFALHVGGVLVDAAGVNVLRALLGAAASGTARTGWFRDAPPEVRSALAGWETAAEPILVGGRAADEDGDVEGDDDVE